MARARLVTEAALASAAADLRTVPPAERPCCPTCGGVMALRGPEVRTLTTTYEQPVSLRRHYLVCTTCQGGAFPLDEELGLLPGAWTPRVQEAAVRLGRGYRRLPKRRPCWRPSCIPPCPPQRHGDDGSGRCGLRGSADGRPWWPLRPPTPGSPAWSRAGEPECRRGDGAPRRQRPVGRGQNAGAG